MDDICFHDQFSSWREEANDSRRFDFIPCLSRQKDGKLADRSVTYNSAMGHVQEVLEQRGISNPNETGAFVCGMDEMQNDVTRLLVDAGVDRHRILTNL